MPIKLNSIFVKILIEVWKVIKDNHIAGYIHYFIWYIFYDGSIAFFILEFPDKFQHIFISDNTILLIITLSHQNTLTILQVTAKLPRCGFILKTPLHNHYTGNLVDLEMK